MPLTHKKILIGITGGIAAYKITDLVRQLKKANAEVRVVMTQSATHFVSEMALQTLSGNRVHTQLFDSEAEQAMGHIELAKWADFFLVAPCTANVIAKLNAGIADDLLTTLALATAAPIAIAPAMNQQMYHSSITQQNLKSLSERGIAIWGPAQGEQACGDVGYGRMIEVNELIEHLKNHFYLPLLLKNVNITITAGPTQEAIDPVRYISNHSSGKMGYAIAEQAAQLGACVTLISGPVQLKTPPKVNKINVLSAVEMNEHAIEMATKSDIFIGCAAVADYRSASVADQKLKKSAENDELVIRLVKNPDIISNVAHLPKSERPFTVGFAAETEHLMEYAKRKLEQKNLDMICANDVSDKNIGFNSDENSLTLLSKNGTLQLPKASKSTIAKQLLLNIYEQFIKEQETQ